MEQYVKLSRFLSLILRHQPEAIGLTLDNYGYLSVNKLIREINNSGRYIDKVILDDLVNSDNKQRYSYNEDKTLIRANQGHSIKVDLGLLESKPKVNLYHGTAKRFEASIKQHGLLKGNREYVHLSENLDTAIAVGSRRGSPVIFEVDVDKMVKEGHKFFLSKNNVWLCDSVPPEYLNVKE